MMSELVKMDEEVKTINEDRSGYDCWRVVRAQGDYVFLVAHDDLNKISRKHVSELSRLRGGKLEPVNQWLPHNTFVLDAPSMALRKRRKVASRHVLPSNYPVVRRAENFQKKECNALFVEMAECIQGKLVFLDTPAFVTAKALVAAGIPCHRFATPQIDKEEYLDMTWSWVSYESLSRHLDQYKPDDIGVLWADYCSTWIGNNIMSPADDMTKVVLRGLVRIGGVVLLTICLRNNKESDVRHQVLSTFGAAWDVEICIRYGGHMLFWALRRVY